MITHEFLMAVLHVEAAIFTAGSCLLLLNAGRRQARIAWLRPRVRAAKEIVSRMLAGGENLAAHPRLPVNQAVRVLADGARSVDEAARGRLRGLPLYDGLTGRAERWCASRRWARRLKGVRLLTILGMGEGVVPALLEDPRAEVRSAAAAWTARHPTAERAARLVLMLEDEALPCRLTAQASLIRLGPSAVPSIVQQLERSEPSALALTLFVGSRLNDRTLQDPALTHQLHSDADVRAGVAEVLTSAGGAEAIKALEKFLSDPAATVRAKAAEGLGVLGYWPSAPLLAERLGDRAWEVRRAAGLALSKLNGPGLFYLQRTLRNDDPFASDMARQVLDLPARTAAVNGKS